MLDHVCSLVYKAKYWSTLSIFMTTNVIISIKISLSEQLYCRTEYGIHYWTSVWIINWCLFMLKKKVQLFCESKIFTYVLWLIFIQSFVVHKKKTCDLWSKYFHSKSYAKSRKTSYILYKLCLDIYSQRKIVLNIYS